MKRRIEGLKWARRCEARPNIPEPKRVRGAKLKGLTYERSLAKALGTRMIWGVWWEFEDSDGRGFCQTDFLGFARDLIVVIECKYTWTGEAEEELQSLYVPVVARALAKPRSLVLSVVVCKKLHSGLDRPVSASLAEALEVSTWSKSPAVWHHLGGVPILQRSKDPHYQSPVKTSLDYFERSTDALA